MAELVLGRLKFHWTGAWASATAYIKDDVVKYGPSAYVCTANHTSGADFDFTKFELMTEGVTFDGDWSSQTDYQVNDIVNYGAGIYICTADHNYDDSTDTAPTNSSYWSRLVGGIEWEGEYSGAALYQKGDIVRFSGVAYIATQDTQGNVPTEVTYWEPVVRGYVENGDWDQSTQYYPGDIVDYGPYKFVVKEAQVPSVGLLPNGDPASATYWTLFLKGLSFEGDYNNSLGYKRGQVVRYGGRQYICTVDADPGFSPEGVGYWALYGKGFDWKSTWADATFYKLDDVIEYQSSAYICIQSHTSQVSTRPDNDTGGVYWQLFVQGDATIPLTTRGDLIVRGASNAAERLPVGPAGSFLYSDGTDVKWGHLVPQNDYFVSPQGDDANDGRTPNTSWKTIKHACEQTFSLGQCRINVSSGTYTEQCPIKVGRSVVLEGNGLGAVTISPNTTRDEGFGTGVSDDGSTPNANSEVFHMNNGARMRNFVFRNFSTGSVLVSLDPGYGPDDTSVWITSQSPYVQNCTSFTPGGTGFKIDGALHNGGYKSMVANDWTQINSDGVGIHVLNDGRSEIVSCFTYYCNIGYLAESGGKIRAIVGNNSYGEYGAVARGFSQSETPLTANLQLSDDTINSVQTITDDVHIFTTFRDSVGNRFYVGHTAPTGTDVSSSWDNTASYPFIAKYNAVGNLEYTYTYESRFGALHCIAEIDGSYYAGGVVYDGGTNKAFLLKISTSGEVQWQKTLGDTSEIVDVTTDGVSYLYALGNHNTNGASLIKVTQGGILTWSKALDYNDSSLNTLVPNSICYAGTPTTSTDTYAAEGDATAEDDIFIALRDTTANVSMIARYDDNGVLVNAYNYGNIFINKLRLDTGNGDGIYMMAAGYYVPSSNKVPLAFRVSVTGDVEWQSQLANGSADGEFKDVLPFGNDVYLAGYVNDATDTYNQGLIARWTSNGSRDWSYTFTNGTDSVWLNGIDLDGVNVLVGGNTTNDGVLANVQRDTTGGLGTVTAGSWAFGSFAGTLTNSSVATKTIQNINNTNLSLAFTDTTLTLNQTPGTSRTVVATRSGFAGIGTGVNFSVTGLSRKPKDGSVMTIAGDSETYFLISVANFDSGAGTAEIAIEPAIPSNKTPNDNTAIIFREAFSQVRMSGHDFLDIGTGGFADTNYPVIISSDYTQQPDQNRETLSEDGGRVFYVTTDQDGNFRVGDYFKVEQSTGRATLSSEEFDLTGLNELQLGSIKAGKQGATVNEFSTDGTLSDNSDQAVPTERAVKTYVDGQLAGISSNSIQDASVTTKVTTEQVSNTVVITANNVETARMTASDVVINEDGADINTRIEGDNESNLLFVDAGTDRVGIKTGNPNYDLEVNGSFAATTKSFVINHPTKEGFKLRYASLEGPENGVYFRGKLENENVIVLPDYWVGLVDEKTISVNITPIGKMQNIFVESINDNNTITLGGEVETCYYTVFAERKDVDPLTVEIKE